MAKIEIDGTKYAVAERLGYNHDVGGYAAMVKTETGERFCVKQGGRWRFWTARDRTAPLVEAMAKGWPKPG